MSEQAPERPTRGEQPKGKPGSAKRGLTKKIGPLPLWAWGGLAIGGALAFYFAKGPGKAKPTPTAQPTGQASANPTSLAGNFPGFGYPTTSATTSTGTTSTTSTGTTGTTTGNGDEGSGDQDNGPGGHGRTGGWKGQHSNGQGSHHGKANPPPTKKTPGGRPRGINPGGPIRRKVNVPPKA